MKYLKWGFYGLLGYTAIQFAMFCIAVIQRVQGLS